MRARWPRILALWIALLLLPGAAPSRSPSPGASTAFTPAQLAPRFWWDTHASRITQDGSHNVSVLGDARSFVTKTMTASGAAMPVLDPSTVVDGRPALTFRRANLSTMATDVGSAAPPAGTPWSIFEIAQLTDPTSGSASGALFVLSDGSSAAVTASLYVGYGGSTTPPVWPIGGSYVHGIASGSGGYGEVIGRVALGQNSGKPAFDLSQNTAYLLAFDGATLRMYVNGRQASEYGPSTPGYAGIPWTLDSSGLHLSGPFGRGGPGLSHRAYAGFFAIGTAPTQAEVDSLAKWTTLNFPSLKLPRQLILFGASGDRGSPASPFGGDADGPAVLAAAAANHPWQVRDYAVNGSTVGSSSNGATPLSSNLWGANDGVHRFGTAAHPDPRSAAQWTGIWDITTQATTNVVSLGFGMQLAELINGASAASTYANLQRLAGMALARGAIVIASTPTPNHYTGGLPAGFQTQRSLLASMIRSKYNLPISAGGLGASYLADCDALASIQDTADTTKYQPDRSHMTVLGYTLVSALYLAILNAIG